MSAQLALQLSATHEIVLRGSEEWGNENKIHLPGPVLGALLIFLINNIRNIPARSGNKGP